MLRPAAIGLLAALLPVGASGLFAPKRLPAHYPL